MTIFLLILSIFKYSSLNPIFKATFSFLRLAIHKCEARLPICKKKTCDYCQFKPMDLWMNLWFWTPFTKQNGQKQAHVWIQWSDLWIFAYYCQKLPIEQKRCIVFHVFLSLFFFFKNINWQRRKRYSWYFIWVETVRVQCEVWHLPQFHIIKSWLHPSVVKCFTTQNWTTLDRYAQDALILGMRVPHLVAHFLFSKQLIQKCIFALVHESLVMHRFMYIFLFCSALRCILHLRTS